MKDQRGPNNPFWKGGIISNASAGRLVLNPGHPRAFFNGYVPEHILIAERALGHSLPRGAIVHHPSHDRRENSSLVICQDRAYHLLLHKREKALKECGHANWKKCMFCQKWDDPQNLFISKSVHIYHSECGQIYFKKTYEKRKCTTP
jgi:hypothetical protein